MLTLAQLNELRQFDITAEKTTLVDLQSVRIDVGAPIKQRIQQYLDQIKNPYAFRIGDVAVKIEFDAGGRSLEDALTSYLKSVMR